MRRVLGVLAVGVVLALAGCAAPQAEAENVSVTPSPSSYSTTGALAAIKDAPTIDAAVAAVLALDSNRMTVASDVLDAINAFQSVVADQFSAAKADPFRIQLVKAYEAVYDDMTTDGSRMGLAQLQDIAKQVRESS